jgi:hypothetical protein
MQEMVTFLMCTLLGLIEWKKTIGLSQNAERIRDVISKTAKTRHSGLKTLIKKNSAKIFKNSAKFLAHIKCLNFNKKNAYINFYISFLSYELTF